MTANGEIAYPDATGNAKGTGTIIGLAQFQNPAGLQKTTNSLYAETAASGAALNEATTNVQIEKSQIVQGYIEGSNVQVADEMVNLIVAQRAYEMNSKVIQTSDDMMGKANELKR